MSAVERSIVVQARPATAFRAWTQHIGTWWPPGHRVLDPSGRVVMEARPGGRFYEINDAGQERDYGEVVAVEPPDLLRYLFFLGGGRDTPTEVTVRFTAVDEGTRVDIVHRAGALGDRFEGIVHRFREGWARTLPAFAAYVDDSGRRG